MAVSWWTQSEGTQAKVMAFGGKWFKDGAEDAGFQTSSDSALLCSSASFDPSCNGYNVIAQCRAKGVGPIQCGAGYVKIGPDKDGPTAFGDFIVNIFMVGPGKRGPTMRPLLVFSYQGMDGLPALDKNYYQAKYVEYIERGVAVTLEQRSRMAFLSGTVPAQVQSFTGSTRSSPSRRSSTAPSRRCAPTSSNTCPSSPSRGRPSWCRRRRWSG